MATPTLRVAERATQFLPSEFLEPAGALTGGAVGGALPLPFAATIGAGAGAATGRFLQQLREARATGAFRPTAEAETLGAFGRAAGTTAALSGAFNFLRNIGRVATFAQRGKFTSRVRQDVEEAVETIGNQFGQEIDTLAAQQPGKTIDLTAEATLLKDMTEEAPSLLRQLATGPNRQAAEFAQQIIADPSAAAAVTLQQAQLLKTALSQMPALAARAGKALTTVGSRALAIPRNLIRQKELAAFPELGEQFRDFALAMDDIRLIHPMLRRGTLAGQIFERGGKLLRDPEARLALRGTLERGGQGFRSIAQPGTFQDILGTARTAAAGRVAQQYGFLIPLGGAATVLGARYLARRGESTRD